ncbi:MAG: ribosome biogenesis GTPase Der [Zoogloeaceae bacterium]|jgi:GTP-binding protein|nr:ribosome biogenesis GTPase Der [Zoogloeaceae bacterium]
MGKPVIALVGRPNVGKSTLFNRLTQSRDALVADFPGLTRDRHYGQGRIGDTPFLVIDTGGFEPLAKEGIFLEMARQTEEAILEADAILFVVDGRSGLNPRDVEIAARLRPLKCPILIAVNKTEGMRPELAVAEFHELGLGEPTAISAAHGDGVPALLERALASLLAGHENIPEKADAEPSEDAAPRALRIAIAGRPNVGKSTFINALLGEERVIAFDLPGTTRDAIDVAFTRKGKSYCLVDTAGLRKKGKVFETIEKFSIIKTLRAIEDAEVVILMLDARQDVADQDAHIADFVLQTGRALAIAVNKWDGLTAYEKEQIRQTASRKLKFLDFARIHFISAKRRVGLSKLLDSVEEAHAAAMADLPTPKLTRVLLDAVARQAPPRHGAIRPKMRYAHQGGMNPPIIVIHGNALEHVPDTYRRYLENTFREAFRLTGTPLRLQFNVSHNPYAPTETPRKRAQKSPRARDS